MRLIAFVVIVLIGLAPARPAWAHASLLSSEPADGAVLTAPPERVILVFNEPIVPLRLQLIGAGGQATILNNVVQHDATLIAVLPGGIGRGTYVLSWRVVSADGHPVGGTLLFSVGEADANPPPALDTTSDLSVLIAIWIAKLALYAALIVGVGGTVFTTWVATARPLPGRTEEIIRALLLGGGAMALFSIGLQGLDGLGVPLSALAEPAVWQAGYDTSYGTTALIALLALAAAFAAMKSAETPVARLRSLLALAGVGLALAASGHAASAMPQWLMRPAVFLHAAAVAFWIGSLGPLAAVLGGADASARQALHRFSRIIPYVILPLLISGTILAIVQLARIDALWMTSYGWVFLAKMAAVAVLFGLAATNRFVFTPRVEAGDVTAIRRMRLSIAAELVVALIILGVVAAWRFTPPPRATAAVAAAPEFIHFHGVGVMADITLDPGRVGRSSAKIVVRGANYEPLTPLGVALIFSQPANGIEPFRRDARNSGNDTWRLEDIVIPTPGRWTLRVEVLVNDFEKAQLESDIEVRP